MPIGNTWFNAVFIVIAILIAIAFVVVIVSVVRNAGKARRHGLDPMTLQADMAAKVMQSDLLAGEQSKVQRLAEVDALLAQDTITPAEHADARAAILRD